MHEAIQITLKCGSRIQIDSFKMETWGVDVTKKNAQIFPLFHSPHYIRKSYSMVKKTKYHTPLLECPSYFLCGCNCFLLMSGAFNVPWLVWMNGTCGIIFSVENEF